MVPVPTEVPSLPLLDGNAAHRHFLWSQLVTPPRHGSEAGRTRHARNRYA
jgi:hypothetical protein